MRAISLIDFPSEYRRRKSRRCTRWRFRSSSSRELDSAARSGMGAATSGMAPGTRFNGPVTAHRVLDARFFKFADLKPMRNTVEGATVTMSPAHRHPPMERTAAVAALVAEAQAVARDLGFEVGEAATGGAGDANTTAAVGLATIDGLAPVGGEAHGPTEWLDLDSVVPRTALLAGLLARLGVQT